MGSAQTLRNELGVSRETIDELEAFTELVCRWSKKINLISRSTMAQAFERHTNDSAQLYRLAPSDAKSWADFGSGGGFPGFVIAIMAKGEGRNIDLALVESDERKAVFLSTAKRQLNVECRILNDRIEHTSPLKADVISARALAPLDKLLFFAELHGHTETECLFPKGKQFEREIVEAQENWRFAFDEIQSITDPQARILRIKGAARAR